MDKKAAAVLSKELVILIIAVLIIFFVIPKINLKYPSEYLGLSNIFSSEKETTTTTTETHYVTDTQYQQVNLCNLFQPIIISGDTVNACNLNGGVWRCEANFVGCRDMVNPAVDCSGSVVQYAMYQCQSVGAIYSCNPYNAYCYYP